MRAQFLVFKLISRVACFCVFGTPLDIWLSTYHPWRTTDGARDEAEKERGEETVRRRNTYNP